jgi:hypothetical protein
MPHCIRSRNHPRRKDHAANGEAPPGVLTGKERLQPLMSLIKVRFAGSGSTASYNLFILPFFHFSIAAFLQ